MPRDTTHRLLDLLVVLHQAGSEPVPLAALRDRIDAYRYGNAESVRRKFERDKDKLRDYGIVIEFTGTGAEGGYRLDRKASFLSVPVPLSAEDRALLAMLAREALRDPAFPHAGALRLALAKLGGEGEPVDGLRVRHPIKDDPAVGERVELLIDALARRKLVQLVYHRPGAAPGARGVAPYGLFLNAGHWYLVGHDGRSDEVRVFRLSRVVSLEVEARRPKTPDYEIPKDFRLEDYSPLDPVRFHAHAPEEVTVRVDPEIDHLARRLWGEPEPDDPTLFRFTSSNHDAVVEQVLHFGRRAEVLAPESVRGLMAERLRALIAAHGGEA